MDFTGKYSNADLNELACQCLIGGSFFRILDSKKARELYQKTGVCGLEVTGDFATSFGSFEDIHAPLIIKAENAGEAEKLYEQKHGKSLRERPDGVLVDITEEEVKTDYPKIAHASEAEKAGELAEKVHMLVTNKLELLKKLKEERPSFPVFFNSLEIKPIKAAVQIGCNGFFFENPRIDKAFFEEVSRAYLSRGDNLPKKKAGIWIGVVDVEGESLLQKQALEYWMKKLGAEGSVFLVRHKESVERMDGVVMPGGWTVFQSERLTITGLREALKEYAVKGGHILGVCGGQVLLATVMGKNNLGRVPLELVDCTADNSMLSGIREITYSGGRKEPALTAAGPIARDLGPKAEAFAWTEFEGRRVIVGVRQGSIWTYAHHDYHKMPKDFLERIIKEKAV